jgi:elongation factor G
MRNEITSYTPGGSGKYIETPAGALAEKVQELHRQLIEYVAESDDTLMERFFEKGILAEEEFRAGLHQAVQKQVVIPLFAVSAETNVGVARLMDFIAKYGSSPLDRAEVPARDASGLPGAVTLQQPEPVPSSSRR